MPGSRDKQLQLIEILGLIAEELDVPEALFEDARQTYRGLGEWLKADHLERYNSDAGIYPQGSIRLGTMIQPVRSEDDYDVDLVYLRKIQKESVSQEQLKTELGEQLAGFIGHLKKMSEVPPNLEEGRRCWTLKYPGRFHLDILPALPDAEASRHYSLHTEEGIIIPDKKHREWQNSNPKGYARWFDGLQENVLLEGREAMAKAANVEVEDIPPSRVSTPLRRAVQVLKRHRDVRYQGNPGDKPISIIISTLVGVIYEQGYGEIETLTRAAREMRTFLVEGKRDGEFWVPNPVTSGKNEENFADKWKEKPQRAEQFFSWLDQVEADFLEAGRQSGLYNLSDCLSLMLGEDIVKNAVTKYGRKIDGLQQQGKLGMASQTGLLGTTGKIVKKNTWYGG